MKNRNKPKNFVIIFAAMVIVIAFIFVSVFIDFTPNQNNTSKTSALLWPITSIDTMKYSRDPSRDPHIYTVIPTIVKDVAQEDPTHIAIATPYDEEFYPVLKAWVDEARKNHLHVWFRGNFSGWEGWFGYSKITPQQHVAMTKAFILNHPDLFQQGDIFTPAPEAENGGAGDPRGSDQKAQDFNQFLVNSYDTCMQSMQTIHKQVLCGYFSTNADIARQVLTAQTVSQIGHVVVIDHYVSNPSDMANTIDYLSQKFNAKIVLGEFGAPIPNINGDMTQEQQADFIKHLLQVFYTKRDEIEGLNYWVVLGGSTTLYNNDNTPRLAAKVLQAFYNPKFLQGSVENSLGDPVPNASITTNDNVTTTTDSNGAYTIPLVGKNLMTLTIKGDGYKTATIPVSIQSQTGQKIILEPMHPNLVYNIRIFFRKH